MDHYEFESGKLRYRASLGEERRATVAAAAIVEAWIWTLDYPLDQMVGEHSEDLAMRIENALIAFAKGD